MANLCSCLLQSVSRWQRGRCEEKMGNCQKRKIILSLVILLCLTSKMHYSEENAAMPKMKLAALFHSLLGNIKFYFLLLIDIYTKFIIE